MLGRSHKYHFFMSQNLFVISYYYERANAKKTRERKKLVKMYIRKIYEFFIKGNRISHKTQTRFQKQNVDSSSRRQRLKIGDKAVEERKRSRGGDNSRDILPRLLFLWVTCAGCCSLARTKAIFLACQSDIKRLFFSFLET